MEGPLPQGAALLICGRGDASSPPCATIASASAEGAPKPFASEARARQDRHAAPVRVERLAYSRALQATKVGTPKRTIKVDIDQYELWLGV